MTTRKTIALSRWTFENKEMSLLFNMLSRLVLTFLNFMATVTICSEFGTQENKICHCFHDSPIYLPWSDGTNAMMFVFWMLSFKAGFSLSSFTFLKRVFSSSLLSAIRVVSSAYLMLLMFLPENLIPAWASSSPAFHVKYSAYLS